MRRNELFLGLCASMVVVFGFETGLETPEYCYYDNSSDASVPLVNRGLFFGIPCSIASQPVDACIVDTGTGSLDVTSPICARPVARPEINDTISPVDPRLGWELDVVAVYSPSNISICQMNETHRQEWDVEASFCNSEDLAQSFGPGGSSLWHNATVNPAQGNGTLSNATTESNVTYSVQPGDRLEAGDCSVILLGGRSAGFLPVAQPLLPGGAQDEAYFPAGLSSPQGIAIDGVSWRFSPSQAALANVTLQWPRRASELASGTGPRGAHAGWPLQSDRLQPGRLKARTLLSVTLAPLSTSRFRASAMHAGLAATRGWFGLGAQQPIAPFNSAMMAYYRSGSMGVRAAGALAEAESRFAESVATGGNMTLEEAREQGEGCSRYQAVVLPMPTGSNLSAVAWRGQRNVPPLVSL